MRSKPPCWKTGAGGGVFHLSIHATIEKVPPGTHGLGKVTGSPPVRKRRLVYLSGLMDIALATSAALPGLSSDDRLLLLALLRAGVDAEPVVWEDPYYEWGDVRACMVRSAWDYAFRRDAFVRWARSVGNRTPLWNSAAVVEWNTHKRYLLDLAAAAVPVVPTRVLTSGTPVDLAALLDETGWDRAVLKAAVAQTGRYLMAVDRDAVSAGQRHLDRLLPHEDMLLQPYLESITTNGEVSLVFLEGELSHAAVKRAPSGDFRVHDDFGGTLDLHTPSDAEVAVGRAALAAVEEPLLHARVDLVNGDDGPLVMELELVEPDLYFRVAAGSADRCAAAIRDRLH